MTAGVISDSLQPKCSFSGCSDPTTKRSGGGYFHKLCDEYYGTPDYDSVFYSSGGTKKKSYSATDSLSYTSTKSSRGSSKANSSCGSYDDGYDNEYDDVYDNDDYDWNRYRKEPDYADGVDDAMDDIDW